ncbi:MAG: class I SAM-dependent methyltransferase [Desulfomonilaceae bacterium]
MYFQKAEFFNTQVNEPWAADQYNFDELNKINRMLNLSIIGEGMRILEPGCGTGRLTRILADRVGATGFVLAMDISERMVDECREKVNSLTNVQVSCAAVENHDFSTSQFDAIICHQVFPHFDDKNKVTHLFLGFSNR